MPREHLIKTAVAQLLAFEGVMKLGISGGGRCYHNRQLGVSRPSVSIVFGSRRGFPIQLAFIALTVKGGVRDTLSDR